jgi:hypothetical protein
MIFIETPVFSRKICELITDDEYSEIQAELANNPKIGDLIKGTGGLRKARFRAKSKGKKGGIRLIYYIFLKDRILLLFVFAKNERDDLTKEQYAKLAKAAKKELK